MKNIKDKLTPYNIVLVVLVLLLVSIIVYKNTHKVAVINNIPEVVDQNIVTEKTTPNDTNIKSDIPQTEKEKLLAEMKTAVANEDYSAFSDILATVYKNQWENNKDFVAPESSLYVTAWDKYYLTGKYDKALEVSTIVYEKNVSAWRFRYLRIKTLESMGRDAFKKGDLVTAEADAGKILHMMFRLEGTNLLADIYIQKIQNNLKDNNIELAKQNLVFIWDYEVSQDRRDILNNLKTQLGM
jgi:hypothetical protein